MEIIDSSIKYGLPPVATCVAAWVGIRYGLAQLREQRRLDLIERQLREFYSPLLGLHKEIRAKSELRLKVEQLGVKIWKEKVGKGFTPSIEPTEREIEYNNKQLHNEFLPKYREMLEIFRNSYWLSEFETKQYYPQLVEFIEIWNRSETNSIEGDVVRDIGHSEAKLHPFYKELEDRMEFLKRELQKGDRLFFEKK